MSNLLDHARSNRAFDECKSALREVGCDVCDVDDMLDVANVIRKDCVAGPNVVINATLASGPGIKVTPIERKGYKISANDEALLSGDLNDALPKGTSIHKALWYIIHQALPSALKTAAAAPAIVDIELIKAGYDGVDYYNNRAFGRKGEGQKAGLHPGEWYLKVTTFATKEPIYTSLGAFMCDFKNDIMKETRRMIGCVVREEMEKHCDHKHPAHNPCGGPGCPPYQPNRPKPCPVPDDSFGGFDPDDNFGVDAPEDTTDEPKDPTVIEQPIDPSLPTISEGTGDCPICNPDDSFGGFEGDDSFGTDSEIENEWDIEDEDGNVTETVPGESQSLENFIDSLK